jgi:hypothetical protein
VRVGCNPRRAGGEKGARRAFCALGCYGWGPTPIYSNTPVHLTTVHVERSVAVADRTTGQSPASGVWIIAAFGMFVADLWLHLPITDFCDALVKKVGWVPYDTFLRRGFLGLGVVTVVIAAVWPRRRNLVTTAGVAALFGAALLAQRFILVAGIENIHYPQYALVALLLLRGGVRPELGFLIAAGLGALDETYQFTALPRGRPTYFDWNDVVLNTLGAAFGVVLGRLFMRANLRHTLLATRRVMCVIGVALLVGLIAAPPMRAPFFTVTPGGREFHQLVASEAVLILGCLWMGMRTVVVNRRSQDQENVIS